jgi:hypothetical protein
MNVFEIVVVPTAELFFSDSHFEFDGYILQGSYERSRGQVPITVRGHTPLLVEAQLPKAHPALTTVGYRVVGDLWSDYDVLITSSKKVRQSGDKLIVDAASISEVVSMPWENHPLEGVICGWQPQRGPYCHSGLGNPGPFRDDYQGQIIRSVALTKNNENQTNSPLWVKLIFKDGKAIPIQDWDTGPINFMGPVFFKNWMKGEQQRVEININVYKYRLPYPVPKAS